MEFVCSSKNCMGKIKRIELLAPAKNLETGKQVVLHGADAVYIGAPKFGARAAASNTLDDIAALVEFAHQYYVRVYVALNTLIYEDELSEVEQMIWKLWEIGVDALIVQDMGITRLHLPPIPLHASTQCDNRSAEKVRFLQEAGFRQVVLARELSISQIKEISKVTNVTLEAFIHGALCVSYSGQCYISHALGGRSANRGVCAQFCRLPYDLVDAKGKVLMRDKYLLSLRDLQRSKSDIEALIDAGVSSFKIEGRLKEMAYCKNVTAYYRQLLDEVIALRKDLKRASSGRVQINFQPKADKTFNRGYTSYFLHGRPKTLYNFDTPKSMGEEVGFVRAQKLQHFIYLGKEPLYNGDGLSYFDENGKFAGFRVNRVDGNKVYPANASLRLKTGIKLYRTANQTFTFALEKNTAQRRVEVDIQCWETQEGFAMQMDDMEGHRSVIAFESGKTLAQKPQREHVRKLLVKSAYPLFSVQDCQIDWKAEYFLPSSLWTEQRNRLYECFLRARRIQYPKEEFRLPENNHPYPQQDLTYLGNVLNSNAEAFYRQHQVGEILPALEAEPFSQKQKNHPMETLELMRCKHCLRYALNACPKQEGHQTLDEPISLVYQQYRLPLQFDCRRCEMLVMSPM